MWRERQDCVYGLQAIRTPRTEYSAQFDLMKDVSVRVYTVLNGPCTNGTMIKSRDYAALVQKPSSTGQGSRCTIGGEYFWKKNKLVLMVLMPFPLKVLRGQQSGILSVSIITGST